MTVRSRGPAGVAAFGAIKGANGVLVDGDEAVHDLSATRTISVEDMIPVELTVSSTGLLNGKAARNVFILGMRDRGWTSTSVLGDVAQYLDTSQALINTPSTGTTLYVVSTSGNDTSAGTGVRTVRIVYLDASGNQQVKSATLNGTTAVSIGTGHSAIQWMESLTAGSGGVAAGTISVTSTNGAATVATTFEQIAAGGDRSMSGRYTVPTGYTAYVYDWHTEAISATMQARLRVDVLSDDRALSAGVFHFQDETFLASGQNARHDQPYLQCPAGSVIKVSAIPGAAPAGNKLGTAIKLLLVAV